VQFSNQNLKSFFPYPEDDQPTEQQHMTIHLTPEQERRLRAVLDRGAYKSVEEVVEARPLNNAPCQVSREHRKNSTPGLLKGLPQNNSRKTSFGVP
jgi:hypothetical protein